MNRHSVAAVLEESTGVPGGDHRQRPTYRLIQAFFRPGFGFTQEPLDLRESFFYRVEIRRVGRQVDEKAAALFDQLAYTFAFMSAQVVHHNHLTLAQRGPQNLLHVSFEDHRSGRTLHGEGGSHPFSAHAREHSSVSSSVARHRAVGPLTLLSPGVQRRKRDVRAHLIYEHQSPSIE